MSDDRYAGSVRKGAFINLLGMVGKLLYPLLFFAVTWLGGPAIAGLYLLSIAIAEMGASIAQAGFTDAVVVYASRHLARLEEDASAEADLYRVLATGVMLPFGFSLLIAVGLQFSAEGIVTLIYSDRPQLAPAIQIIGWTLPLIAISQAGIAATKARLRMEQDALLNGFVRPALLLLCSVVFWQMRPTLTSLLWALPVTYAVLALLSARAFCRYYSLELLCAALRRAQVDREVLRFGVPQCLYTTCDKYLTRIDLMMLAALGCSNFELGLYGSAAVITVNIREVRLIFSGALGPVVARYHAVGDRTSFEALLGQVSRWVTTIAAPIVLLVGVMRADILRGFDSAYGQADTRFMLLLLIAPLLNCAFGLVGNCIVFTGHSGFNLLNAVLVGGLNTAFNYVMIPRFGLMGAASATALSSLLVTILQVIELRALEQVRVRLRDVYKPYLGFALCALAFLWDPAPWSVPERIMLCLGLPLGFLTLMLALGHEEAWSTARRVWSHSSKGWA